MRVEEFDSCVEWWGGEKREGREEGGSAWKVSAADIEKAGYNLDIPNPHAGEDLAHRSPEELVDELIKTEREILGLLEELREEIGASGD
jgi:type I restriction enzyme M protein